MNVTALRLATSRRIGARTFPLTMANNGNLLRATSRTLRWPVEANKIRAFLLPVLPHYWLGRGQIKDELRMWISTAEKASS